MKRIVMVFGGLLLAMVMGMAMTGAAWGTTMEIKGSTTVLPAAQKVAEAFMKEYPDVSISISGGGSGNGVKAIIDGTTDVAMSSRFIKDKEVKLALERGSYPVPFAVAYDCIVPVVHPSNPLKNISLEQLGDVYKGKIKNWKELGGLDKRIVVISRDTSSGTYEVWHKKVLKKKRVFPGALLQASNGAVAQAVANNKYAIGYVGIGYLNDRLKAISIDNVYGSPKTALDATFPVSRALFLFTAGWPEGDASTFINYFLNPGKGQKLVEEAGFVPLY